ncbi:putative histidine kinase [Magnetofaba australis IT-1]|uniref:histidine kinase n=2 Tax=Magnetofaba TaxID=1472292 RepID=A0A1Y2JZ18_9PROT|nr:putative histidine kinase [Magnetofaba australis IT-1]
MTLYSTIMFTQHEIEELSQRNLQQAAEILRHVAPEALSEQALAHYLHQSVSIDADHDPIAFQIWVDGALRAFWGPGEPPPPPIGTGWRNGRIAGEPARLYVLRDTAQKLVIQVGESDQELDGLFIELLEDIVPKLIAVFLMLLAALIWAVRWTFQPIARLTEEVAQLNPDQGRITQTSRLDMDDAPLELQPLTQALNGLMARLACTMARERQFIAFVSHELNAPLTGIRLQAQAAQKSVQEAFRIHALERIVQSIDQGSHIVEQLAALARMDALEANDVLERTPTNLTALSAQMLAEMADAFSHKSIRVERVWRGAVSVQGDPALLHTLLRNLLENAARHTPTGGAVRVEVSLMDGGAVCWRVENSGADLDASTLAKIQARVRLEVGRSAAERGFGLILAQRIVLAHRGAIEFDQSAMGGLRATVHLPTA